MARCKGKVNEGEAYQWFSGLLPGVEGAASFLALYGPSASGLKVGGTIMAETSRDLNQPDWLVVRSSGVGIISLLVPAGLGSTCLWAACS